MQYTENYSLRKPQAAETASYQDLNYNSDKIDGIMADNRQISLSMYVSGNTYNTGDLVGYENPSTHHIRVYRCLVDNVTGVWDSTKWTLTNLADEILDAKASGGTEVEANPTGTASDTLNTVKIDNVIYAVGGDSANQNIADAFSELQTYAVGDYCIYESILYKCTTAVTTAGAWDSTKWTSCVVTDEMGSGGGGGSSTLAGLDDVGVTTPTDGQLLVYDDANDEWVNGNIAGVNVQPVIYSTEEREVGVWIDGRPLYQKTFRATSSSSTSTAAILAETGAGTEIVDFFGTINGARDIISNLDTNQWSYSWISANKYQLANFAKGTSYAGLPTVTTCRYIKTADTAGSGTWTPSGVPAVHYSTNEQVVGTWSDGSTVYEKTFQITSISSSNTDLVDISSLNIDTVIDLTGMLIGTAMILPIPLNDSSSNNVIVFITKATDTMKIRGRASFGNGSFSTGYITVRYTKTSS